MASDPYILSSKEDISLIFTPLKTTQRIKYTCFNVSQNFLVLGATSGGLYVFKREPCSFLQLLPNKEGIVSHVSVSPSERLFAFSTVKGIVCVLQRNEGAGARLLQTSREHCNAEITGLQWNTAGNELYVSDNLGRISVVNIIIFTTKHIFNTPSFMLMQLDSRVVQMDWFGSLLLVSTMTRCYLCDTYKEEYHQIGQKLRDGEFGACFLNVGDESVPQRLQVKERKGKFSSLGFNEKSAESMDFKDVKVFCARPGSRVWEVDIDGSVKSTHEFKNALAVEPADIVSLVDKTLESDSLSCDVLPSASLSGEVFASETLPSDKLVSETLAKRWAPQSFNFVKLFVLFKRFLFTFRSDGIYIFDPIKAVVVLWNGDFKNIIDCKIFSNVIYVRLSTGIIHAISFSSIENILVGLYLCKNYVLCADFCWKYHDYLVTQIDVCSMLRLLLDLKDKLPNYGSTNKILPFLNELSKYYKDKSKCQKLKSGIFRVGNLHSILSQDDCSNYVSRGKSVVANKEVSHSLSTSPVMYTDPNCVTLKKSSSCSSLAEILKTKDSQFESQRNGFCLPSAGQWDASSMSNDLFTSEFLLPFSGITSPETIQTLKHISHSVSGTFTKSKKSIKDTWHVFEDKVKLLGQELPQEPFDIGPHMVESMADIGNNRNDVVEDNIVLKLKTVPKKLPVLDTQHIADVCASISGLKQRGEDFSLLALDLFKSVDSLCSLWDARIIDSEFRTETENTTAKTYFSSDAKPFPFMHYLTTSCTQIIQETLVESLTSKLLITWLESLPLQGIKTRIATPQFLFTFYPVASLDVDRLLSNILIVFSELIDPETIVNLVKMSEVPCYYHMLCTILELHEEGALNARSCKSGGDGNWVLPTLLNAMYCVLRMGQAETCSKMGESVPLKDVLYVVLRLHSELVESGVESSRALLECETLFLRYLDNIHDNSFVVSALEDLELRSFILHGFESLHTVTSQSCDCGFPLPTRPLVISSFPNIGYLVSNFLWANNPSRFKQLAGRIPGLWLCIIHLRRHEDVRSLLPILLHVGDAVEWECRGMSLDRAVWLEALQLFAKLQAGTCLNCGARGIATSVRNGITWSVLGTLMVKSLGASDTIDMLMAFESQIPPGGLDARFYQSCLLATELDRTAPGSRSQGIQMLSNSPSRHSQPMIQLANMDATLLDALAADLGTWKSHRSVSTPEYLDHSSKHVDSMITSTSLLPWGVCVDVLGDVCPCCTLPLNTRVLLNDGGITSFRCGHTFHSVCIKHHNKLKCLVCKKS